MFDPDFYLAVKREQLRDYLAAAERERLAALYRPRLSLARRAARPLGRALLRLGTALQRYGRGETPVPMLDYQPSTGSIRLN